MKKETGVCDSIKNTGVSDGIKSFKKFFNGSTMT